MKQTMKTLRLRSGKRAEDIAAAIPAAISSLGAWETLQYPPRGTPLRLKRMMEVYGCTFEELCEAEEACLEAKNKCLS
jgi:putative transcriptional regulator